MHNHPKLTKFTSLLVTLVAGLPAILAQNPQPSLVDTERWLTQTMGENTGVSLCSGFDSHSAFPTSTDSGPDITCTAVTYEFKFDGCKVTTYVRNYHTLINSAQNIRDLHVHDQKMDYLLSFSFSNIDPTSIVASDVKGNPSYKGSQLPYASINFRTTDDADNMTMHGGASGQSFPDHDCCNFGIGIDVVAGYAPRFVKALKNAATLCGGKPSAF